MLKHQTLFFLLIISSTVFSQTSTMYVSLKDGKSNLFCLGKTGYNKYYFVGLNSECDTLTCEGKGLKLSKVNVNNYGFTGENKKRYKKFNKAIRKAKRKVRRKDTDKGNFAFSIRRAEVEVDYKKYSDREMTFVIELIE